MEFFWAFSNSAVTNHPHSRLLASCIAIPPIRKQFRAPSLKRIIINHLACFESFIPVTDFGADSSRLELKKISLFHVLQKVSQCHHQNFELSFCLIQPLAVSSLLQGLIYLSVTAAQIVYARAVFPFTRY